MSTLIKTISKYVEDLFSKNLPTTFVHHNYGFTQRIVKNTEEIIHSAKINANESEILVLASLLCHIGFTKGYENREDVSASMAGDILKSHGAKSEVIDAVMNCILVTNPEKLPETKLDKIIKDSTTFYYGKKRYHSDIKMKRLELEFHGVTFKDEVEWLNSMIKELTAKHKFYTDYAIKNWKPRKEKNLDLLLSAKAKLRKDKEKEKLKAKYKVEYKNADPERGIQTFYRVALRNHIKLSDIADTKANILLSVNAIIISLILSNLISKLDNPSNHYLIIPTIIFILFSVISMVLSILATRPNVTRGEFTEADIKNKKVNLTFFGNFHKMELSHFESALKTMLNDKDYIYSSLAKDLYFLGEVLNKKYKILRITYTIFMIGIIISVLAFAVMFKTQGS